MSSFSYTMVRTVRTIVTINTSEGELLENFYLRNTGFHRLKVCVKHLYWKDVFHIQSVFNHTIRMFGEWDISPTDHLVNERESFHSNGD